MKANHYIFNTTCVLRCMILSMIFISFACDDQKGSQSDSSDGIQLSSAGTEEEQDISEITQTDTSHADMNAVGTNENDMNIGTADAGEQAGMDHMTPILQVSPQEVTLVIRNLASLPTQNFTLSLIQGDSTEVIDPTDASWSLTAALGSIEAGEFISNGTAGSARILIEYQATPEAENLVDVATINVEVSQDLDTILDGLTTDDLNRFDQASVATNCNGLTFIYPEADTVIPINLTGFSFQWNHNNRQGPYLITAQSGMTRLRWLTDNHMLTPAGVEWERAKSDDPNLISTWSISYLTNSGERCDGNGLDIRADYSRLSGAVYYWSTADSGIMRLAAGDTEPEPLLTPQVAPEINCPACHALSRDGSRIAFTRTTFPPFGELAVSSILTPRMLNYNPSGVSGYFPSFSPNPNTLVAGYNGKLRVMDSNTGSVLEELFVPTDMVAGSPDWSWQGERITATVAPAGLANPIPDADIIGGSIYEWIKQDQTWAMPQEVIPAGSDSWNDRPAYSPDGTWIAYNVIGEDPNPNDDHSGNTNVALWIKRVGDHSAPIRLDKANQAGFKGNSWPKWSPHDRRGKLWLAFSSIRDYGHQLTDGATPQIWVTAIDLNAEEGEDPSSPAFWLPYQSVRSGNHIPYWAPYEKQ